MKTAIETIFVQVLIIALFLFSGGVYAQKQFRVLLFTATAGYHHQSINEGITALKNLAARNHFDLDWDQNPGLFNQQDLGKYDAVIFLNTTGDVLNDDQQTAFEHFIRSGKGFVGIHSASDTEYDWEWYTKLVGRVFFMHPPIQTAKLKVEKADFPGMEGFPKEFWWTDEWYEFGEDLTGRLTVLLTVDESTYDVKAEWDDKAAKGMGDFHPVSWYQYYDGGRSFYTALGHIPETFESSVFLDHLYGGIFWAATGKGSD